MLDELVYTRPAAKSKGSQTSSDNYIRLVLPSDNLSNKGDRNAWD